VAESPKEKTDRQFIELLNELRVALPGAQVLLGFLLTAPLASRFSRTDEVDRSLLYTCTIVTAVGVLLLMAPSVYHRMRWNRGGKRDVIEIGHRLFLAGTACLAAGLLCAVYVTGHLLLGSVAALVATTIPLVVVFGTWYLLPLRRGGDPRIHSKE
jgi:drug/metabolite transporter (DMT)-like permease